MGKEKKKKNPNRRAQKIAKGKKREIHTAKSW